MKIPRLPSCTVILAVLALAAALFCSALLSPWMRAGTHPFVVSALLPKPWTTLYAELPDGWRARLVHVREHTYATELPPRKSYEGIVLGTSSDELWYTSSKVDDIDGQEIKTTNITGVRLPCDTRSGVKCLLVGSFSPKCYFWKAFLPIFPLFLLLFFGVAALVRKTPAEETPASRPGFSLWQWGLLLALAAGEVLLVATSNPLFWSADSIGYTSKALSLYANGTYSTGGIYQEILRSPGAPLVEAAGWKLFGFSFASVALLQALLYASACLLALYGVAKALSRNAALFAAPFLFFAPAAVFGCRLMASEGPFSAFALATCGAFLLALAHEGRRRLFWILAASLLTGYAVLIRPNGVALLALPIFLFGKALISTLRERRAAPLRPAFLWILPITACLGTLGAWTLRNAICHDFPAPTDIGGLSMAEACFKNGALDLYAACDDRALYDEVVKARYESGYNFQAWDLSHLYQKRIEAHGPLTKAADRRMDGLLSAFAARSRAATPAPAHAAALLRIFGWGLWLHKDANYQPYGQQDYRFVTYPDADWDYTNSVVTGWIHKDLGFAQKPPHAAQRAFNALMPLHAFLYTLASGLGVFFFALAAARGWTVAFALLLPYYGNLLLNTLLGVVVARYVTVLEPLLILGIAAGVCEALREAKDWRKSPAA